MRRICGSYLAVALILSLASSVGAQKRSPVEENTPLILTTQVPLPGVHGRFDHFAFDPVEPHYWYPGTTGCDLCPRT
jgi:hypothetical protein